MTIGEVVLIDTGPLIAMVDKADPFHSRCVSAFRSLKASPLTTWPCLTEAFYMLGELRGWKGQKTLLSFLTRGSIHIHPATESEISRIAELMEKYKDTPMDFSDASLVVLAELTGLRKIFTLDSDFYLYRINGKETFDVISLSTL